MLVTKSTVEKLTITGVPELDAVVAIMEDTGDGSGKVTITCFGVAWTHYWSHMGEGVKLADFFCNCSNAYLAMKLSTGIESTVTSQDEDELGRHLKSRIIEMRKSCDIGKDEAEELWELAIVTDYQSHDNLYRILGEEWWYDLPKVPNADYEYLCRIIDAVKAALKQLGEMK